MATNQVHIFDTTLRDGEQVPGCQLDPQQKVEIAVALEALGVDIIEAGFPVSSPADFDAVQRIAGVLKNTTTCALTRAVVGDIEAAGDALRKAKHPRIHTGLATSDLHLQTKLRMSREQALDRAIRAVKHAKNFADDVEFYAEDAGRTDNRYLAQVVEAVIKAGATVVNIPDTTGYCLPNEYGKKIKYLKRNVSNIEQAIIATHCHNDLGLATANSIAGIQNGARQIECTINGIGERAGNTALEEVVMIMQQHKDLGVYHNINTPLICPTSHLVSEKMNMPVQPNKAIVGSNAFAHSSGIHQDGVLKNRKNYEIIDPKEVGSSPTAIVLTSRSGRAALHYHAKKMGYQLTPEQLNTAYHQFLEVTDLKKAAAKADLELIFEGSLVTQH